MSATDAQPCSHARLPTYLDQGLKQHNLNHPGTLRPEKEQDKTDGGFQPVRIYVCHRLILCGTNKFLRLFE